MSDSEDSIERPQGGGGELGQGQEQGQERDRYFRGEEPGQRCLGREQET